MLAFPHIKTIVWLQKMLKIMWKSFELLVWCFLVLYKIVVLQKYRKINTKYGMMDSCRSKIWHSCFKEFLFLLFRLYIELVFFTFP